MAFLGEDLGQGARVVSKVDIDGVGGTTTIAMDAAAGVLTLKGRLATFAHLVR